MCLPSSWIQSGWAHPVPLEEFFSTIHMMGKIDCQNDEIIDWCQNGTLALWIRNEMYYFKSSVALCCIMCDATQNWKWMQNTEIHQGSDFSVTGVCFWEHLCLCQGVPCFPKEMTVQQCNACDKMSCNCLLQPTCSKRGWTCSISCLVPLLINSPRKG